LRGKLNVIIGNTPLGNDRLKDRFKANILKYLYERYEMVESDFISAELEVVPAGPARDIGMDASMIGGYAHDDRSCTFCAWFWIKVTQKSSVFLIILFAQWLIAIYYANINGWSAFTLYLCIMLPVLAPINAKIPDTSSTLIPNPKLFWSVPVIFMIITGLCTSRSVSFREYAAC
jgi:Aspartyl aminopeptidase